MPKRNYKIKFVDKILDPVHGFIDITEVERAIIALPIFKRLQSIKQLSMTNWVFPGAEHTRYIHSLGVMHIADQMAIHLDIFNDEKRQLLRLAGLLHDIGHYPLSHVTESVYLDKNLVVEEITLAKHNSKIKKDIDKICQKEPPEYMKSRLNKPMHHEYMGVQVIESDDDIKRIIKKYCPFVNVKDICDIIVGNVENSELSILVQLMHSELDADGIDYIMRDASFSGTSYGGFQLGMLLRNLAVKEYNGVGIVGVKPKGIPIVDQYLMSKYFAYTQVIFNKHVAIYDTMAEMLTSMMIDLAKSDYQNVNELKRDIKTHCTVDNYLNYTDNFFWSQLSVLEGDVVKGKVEPFLVTIYNNFFHYQEQNCENELIITSNNPEEVQRTLQNSSMYNEICSGAENALFLYHTKGFVSEVKETDYKELLKIDGAYDEAMYVKNNTTRLQEGVAVICDDDKEPKLLVDDDRSIMSHLHDAKTYILRKYVL